MSLLLKSASLALLTMLATTAHPVFAKSPVKLVTGEGLVDLTADGPQPFTLDGTASHVGQFSAYGEVEFVPGEEEGSRVGTGVTVLEAANGDRLVGTVSWDIDPDVDGTATSHVHFSWSDAVEFSDGTTVDATGRFVSSRPPGVFSTLTLWCACKLNCENDYAGIPVLIRACKDLCDTNRQCRTAPTSVFIR